MFIIFGETKTDKQMETKRMTIADYQAKVKANQTDDAYLAKAMKAKSNGSPLSIEELVATFKKSDERKAKKEKRYTAKFQAKQAMQSQVDAEWAAMTAGQRLQRTEDIRNESLRNQAKAL